MISMLIDDNPKLELTDQDASHLVRVLCASAKKAVGGKVVPSAESRKVTLSKAQKVSCHSQFNTFFFFDQVCKNAFFLWECRKL